MRGCDSPYIRPNPTVALWGRFTHLAVVGAAVLGYSTLPVHQEAVSPALLGQGRLVALGDEGVQLALLTADGLYKLNTQNGGVSIS